VVFGAMEASASAPDLGAGVGDADTGVDALPSLGDSPNKQEQPDMLSTTLPSMKKSDSTPGPGNYMWNDDVNRFKKPVWSVQSPDRSMLDLMLGTWTPASSACQPRAPDPGEYGMQDTCGYRGPFTQPKWSQARYSGRPCLAPNPPERIEVPCNLPPAVGPKHPTKTSPANWSVFGKDRSQLPADLPTWTPKPNTDVRPGPGSYNLDRTGKKWKATTRSGCTWGRKINNLHPDERAYITQTRGAQMGLGGDMLRYRAEKDRPKPPVLRLPVGYL